MQASREGQFSRGRPAGADQQGQASRGMPAGGRVRDGGGRPHSIPGIYWPVPLLLCHAYWPVHLKLWQFLCPNIFCVLTEFVLFVIACSRWLSF